MPALNLTLPCAQTTPVAPKASAPSPDKAQQNTDESTPPQGFADQLDARVKDSQSKDSTKEPQAKEKAKSDTADSSDPAESSDASAAAAAALAALLGTQTTPVALGTGASAPKTIAPAVTTEASSSAAQTAAVQTIAAAGSPNAAAIAAAAAKPATPQLTQAPGEDKGNEERSTAPLGQPVAREALPVVATPVAQEAADLGAKPHDARANEQGAADASSVQTNQAQNFAEQLNARTAHLARSEAPQIAVHTQVAQPGWAEEVGNRISWMASKDMGKAELVLTPAHLGRVEISLSVDGDQASAAFVTATPAAREALEQSIPRLREVLSQAGLNLGQVNVSANNANTQGRQDGRSGTPRARASADISIGGIRGAALASQMRQANGLVDTFA